MRINALGVLAVLMICGLAAPASFAQREKQKSADSSARATGESTNRSKARVARALTPDDGLSVIAAALDSRFRLPSHPDCSHLVHTIYDRAGFPYPYVDSSDLYIGTRQFQRVVHPQPGDLVAWRGHVGIVVNPAHHVFFSALGSGPGIDVYNAPYWKQRGQLRFYRYIKPPGLATANDLDHFAPRHQDE